MKNLLAKTLTSTALVLATFSSAHAYSDNKGPQPTGPIENGAAPLPSQTKYFEQREAAIAKEVNDRPSGRGDYIPKQMNPRL